MTTKPSNIHSSKILPPLPFLLQRLRRSDEAGQHRLGDRGIAGFRKMIEIDVDRVRPIVKQRRQVDRVGGIGDFATAPARVEDRGVEAAARFGVLCIVLVPALLIAGQRLLCGQRRLPEKDRAKAVLARQEPDQPQIRRISGDDFGGESANVDPRQIRFGRR